MQLFDTRMYCVGKILMCANFYEDEAVFYKEKLTFYLKACCKIGNFTLSSGKKSNFYIDCREALLRYEVINHIGAYIKAVGMNLWFHSVAGVTSGADPIICSIVMNCQKNGLFIRKASKDHGVKKIIEGFIPVDKTVLIVDDVLTTGGNIIHACDTLLAQNLIPEGIFVVVDREENNATELLKNKYNIPIYSLLTKSDLIKELTP